MILTKDSYINGVFGLIGLQHNRHNKIVKSLTVDNGNKIIPFVLLERMTLNLVVSVNYSAENVSSLTT